ncbi:hypothetical protein LINPERPRIM_LOCUS37460, partial [Linum perenne]
CTYTRPKHEPNNSRVDPVPDLIHLIQIITILVKWHN